MKMKLKNCTRILAWACLLLFFAMGIFSYSFAADENTVIVKMTASVVKKDSNGKFSGGWNPRKITAQQGQTVVLKLTSADVTHVFALDDYEINVEVNPGETKTVTFVANKAGIFYYHCGMECGPYHQHMLGQLVVNQKT